MIIYVIQQVKECKMKNQDKNLTKMYEQASSKLPLVAILRGVKPEEVCEVADALIAGGFTMLEVPMNSPEPLKSIELLRKHCPADILVGAGTVLNIEDVKKLNDINAELIVTPNFNEELVKEVMKYNFVSLIGCFSPSECFSAVAMGVTAIKVFPANTLGANYIKNIKAVLPVGTQVLAVGGIDPTNMKPYTDVAVDGFGIASSLYKPGRAVDEIKKIAIEFTNNYNNLKGK